MLEGIKKALELIKAGEYRINEGKLYNKFGKELGTVNKYSGNMYTNIGGVSIGLTRLIYAYYFGIDKLDKHSFITHKDGDKTNNHPSNLVQVSRKFYQQEIDEIRNQ